MPASKALVFLLVVGLLVLLGVFFIFPDYRPGFVKSWFRKAQGFTAAQSPTEALDKFREAVKKRDYETAATYCGGEYGEEMRISAKEAEKLGKAVDDITYVADEVVRINSDKIKLHLFLIQPFPNDFKVLDLKHKEGEDKASASLQFEGAKQINTQAITQLWKLNGKILLSLVPSDSLILNSWDGVVELKNEGTKDKPAWKIVIPVPPRLRDSASYLRENGRNFVAALGRVKTDVKNDATTKDQFENTLKAELEKAGQP